MRTFRPKPVARLLEAIGGVSTLLGLVAMSTDTEGLYASLKALLCAIRSNRAIAADMESIRGYQVNIWTRGFTVSPNPFKRRLANLFLTQANHSNVPD